MSTTTQATQAEITGEYTIDPAHSRVGFQARHAMITKVRGAFNEFEGRVHLDADEPTRSSASVTIQAASIDTRNADRDAHLRGNDFLAMDEFPTITFASTAVEVVDQNNYLVTGDLTIRGITRPVTVPFEVTGSATDPFGSFRLGFEASLTINRKDWGVSWNAPLEAGGILVGEKVTIELELSLVKSSA